MLCLRICDKGMEKFTNGKIFMKAKIRFYSIVLALSLPQEVEAANKFESTVCVCKSECLLTVGIGVEVKYQSCEIF